MKKIIMLLTAASILAASCNHNWIDYESQTEGTTYTTRLYKAGLETATKTAVDVSGKVSWEQGDIIRYYSRKNGEVKEFTVAEAADRAQLSLDIASDASFVIGVCGVSALKDNLGTSVTIEGAVPAVQTGNFGDHHISITKTYDVTQQTLSFHNLVSYIKFTLTRDDVAKVIFKAVDGTQLHGNGIINVNFVSDSVTVESVSYGSTSGSAITVNNCGSGTFYIATLPPCHVP